MKNNFEKTLKEKLENYEAPYDAASWSSMSSKLDARSKGSSNFSTAKWIAVTAVISIGLYVGFSDFNSETKEVVENEKIDSNNLTTKKENSKPTEQSISKTEKELKPDHNDDSNATIVKKESNNEAESKLEDNNSKNITAEKKQTEKVVTDQKNITIDSEVDNSKEQINHSEKKISFIQGSISNQEICEGEEIIIRNTGEKDEFVRILVDDLDLTIPSGQQSRLNIDQNSTISFVNDKGEVLKRQEVVILSRPQTDFAYKSNLYNEGVPVVELESFGSYKDYKWYVNDDEVSSKQLAIFNPFVKGSYDVTLEVTDFNGCSTKKTRTVKVEKDYNLMAVNAFKPSGADSRNRTFMPYALTQRDVKFTLTIIDPRDHGVLFTTNDPNDSWNGIDRRTGKLTPAEKVYMWKVELENPLPGERPVYAGTILHN